MYKDHLCSLCTVENCKIHSSYTLHRVIIKKKYSCIAEITTNITGELTAQGTIEEALRSKRS